MTNEQIINRLAAEYGLPQGEDRPEPVRSDQDGGRPRAAHHPPASQGVKASVKPKRHPKARAIARFDSLGDAIKLTRMGLAYLEAADEQFSVRDRGGEFVADPVHLRRVGRRRLSAAIALLEDS